MVRRDLRPLSLTLVALLLMLRNVGAVTIQTVQIGNPGNFNDSTGFGQVFNTYSIGKYEVTNGQYVEFLNAKDVAGINALQLYEPHMASSAEGGIVLTSGAAAGAKYTLKAGYANQPVTYISWFDAIRFANWMNNGQGNGDTESGAYTILGGTPIPSNATSIARNVGARWFVPTINEWYKAAYHKNDGVTGNYWAYPTSSNTAPISDQPTGAVGSLNQANSGNFYSDDLNNANSKDDGYAVTASPNLPDPTQDYLTDVGAYTLSPSPYGTFDQGGNVWEWTENEVSALPNGVHQYRGGSWSETGAPSNPHSGVAYASSSQSINGDATFDSGGYMGFRVATSAAPLPGDYNKNGVVDAPDYVLWRKTPASFGGAGGYDIWRTNFGKIAGLGSGLAGSAVPEPTSAVLLLFGLGGFGFRHRSA